MTPKKQWPGTYKNKEGKEVIVKAEFNKSCIKTNTGQIISKVLLAKLGYTKQERNGAMRSSGLIKTKL